MNDIIEAMPAIKTPLDGKTILPRVNVRDLDLTERERNVAHDLMTYVAQGGSHPMMFLRLGGIRSTTPYTMAEFRKTLNALVKHGLIKTELRKRTRSAKRGGYGSTHKWLEYSLGTVQELLPIDSAVATSCPS